LKRRSNILIGLLVASAFAPALGGTCRAEIILDTSFPSSGRPTRIILVDDRGAPVPDADVTATYRPGSRVSRTDDLGRTGSEGVIEWTPRKAGIVTLRAVWSGEDGTERTASINASVRFDPVPVSGLVVLTVAGILLLGGSIERISALLRSPEAH
jgi:hypothetical protein